MYLSIIRLIVAPLDMPNFALGDVSDETAELIQPNFCRISHSRPFPKKRPNFCRISQSGTFPPK
ncbi:MAG: hypothetical protein Q8881_04095 [Sweet potato little leaf phytoplasma]|nr:hypothetical protein [Sweet potato little leaf phytoplasma]